MRVDLATDMCPIIIPDTYGSEFCYDVLDYMWEDFKELMVAKAEVAIKYALQDTDFKDAQVTMGKFGSPREYNFTTDWIEFSLDFDQSVLEKQEYDDDFFEYIKKFGTRSGFISFYPVAKSEFLAAVNGFTTERDLNLAVAMLILYQFEKSNNLEDYQEAYLEDVREYAECNGYISYDED